MTIAIKITNEDSRDKAVVSVRELRRQEKSMLPFVDSVVELQSGQSTTRYVHGTQSLIVEELENG